MTNTEQNIACALLEGTHTVTAIMPNHFEVVDSKGKSGKFGEGFYECDPEFTMWPNYLSDLNACARLVAKLTDEQRYRYHTHIFMFFHPWADPIDATAPQRVEAILRATGKWRDDL